MFEVDVEVEANCRYDQAGVMLRKDKENWLKISAEWLTAENAALGSVNTRDGKSDWASQNTEPQERWKLKVQVTHDDALVFVYLKDQWQQVRVLDISHLRQSASIQLGVYACSPNGKGCRVTFHSTNLS